MEHLTQAQNEFFKGLTLTQQIVVAERIKGRKLEDCYYATGYKGDNLPAARHAHKICALPHIKKFMNEVIGDCSLAEDAIAGRKDVMKRLTGIMDANLFDILDFEFDDNGRPIAVNVKNKKELALVQQLAVKKVEPSDMGLRVTLHDPIEAIKQLCKMQGYDAPTKKQIKIERLDDAMREAVDKELEGEY
jgi:hypothetical protein